MSKKDGQKSDSNDNNNNASNNAIQRPKWRYVAMVNTAYRVTTKVVMQWVAVGLNNAACAHLLTFSPM